MGPHDFALIGIGALIGLTVSQGIALWGLNKGLKSMRDALDFREECLDLVRDMAGEDPGNG